MSTTHLSSRDSGCVSADIVGGQEDLLTGSGQEARQVVVRFS